MNQIHGAMVLAITKTSEHKAAPNCTSCTRAEGGPGQAAERPSLPSATAMAAGKWHGVDVWMSTPEGCWHSQGTESHNVKTGP